MPSCVAAGDGGDTAARATREDVSVDATCASSDNAQHAATTDSSPVLQTDGHQLAQLLARLRDLQVTPHPGWLADALEVLRPQLGVLRPSELSSCLAALGSWSYPPPLRFMAEYTAEVRARLRVRTLGLREIADVTWALAQLEQGGEPLLGELLDAAGAALGDDALAAAAAPGVQHRPLLSSPGALADLIWGVAKLGASPDNAWLCSFAAASAAALPSFAPRQLAQLVWAFARLPYTPEPAWVDVFLAAVQVRLPLQGLLTGKC